MKGTANKRVTFHVGGPAFHPVGRQAMQIMQWVGAGYECAAFDGRGAFEHIERADLLVLMGLEWTGMEPDMKYNPPEPRHRDALERYAASGRPIIAHHGAIASYDDWPRFGEIVGFAWIWGKTNHSPIADYTVRTLATHHPIIGGIGDYTIHDELYYDIKIARDLKIVTHAEAEFEGKRLPMVMTTKRAGKIAYLANGHDMKAFACPAMKRLWINTINWALDDRSDS